MNFERPQDESVEKATAPKVVDRRQKLAPKPEVVAGPGDVLVDESILEAAREELAREGNKNPTQEQLMERARIGVFSTMSDEEVADRAIDATMANPESAAKIGDRATIGIKTDLVVEEARTKKATEEEEQSRKIEEVERVRAETSRKTAEAIQRGKEAKGKEAKVEGDLAA